MTELTQFAPSAFGPVRPLPAVIGRFLTAAGLLGDISIILAISILAGVSYHLAVYAEVGKLVDYAKVGGLAGLLYAFWHFQVQKEAYLTSWSRQALRELFFVWNMSFLCLLALGFIAKTTGIYSRGAMLLFYASGLPVLVLWQTAWMALIRKGLARGWFAFRSVLLLGTLERIDEFRRKFPSDESGLLVADVVVLPQQAMQQTVEGEGLLKDSLTRALGLLRQRSFDDVFVLVPWSATHAVDTCADTLTMSPVSIHLGPEPVFDRFSDLSLSKLGEATTLNLARPPLSPVEVLCKRIFDVALASAALLLLSPLLLVVSVLIKLDSEGPVFFVQRRHGFNAKPFRIIKFRSMTVAEDGPLIRQAVANDPRLTRVGRFLRRWNIDELPQLLNVIKGDMSLVGPRPHALTHNLDYERRIAFYARRHNIKPGITGWAQVNGCRGETDTGEKMQRRVQYDLHYIDNWSMLLDLYILALTVVSPSAYANAH